MVVWREGDGLWASEASEQAEVGDVEWRLCIIFNEIMQFLPHRVMHSGASSDKVRYLIIRVARVDS